MGFKLYTFNTFFRQLNKRLNEEFKRSSKFKDPTQEFLTIEDFYNRVKNGDRKPVSYAVDLMANGDYNLEGIYKATFNVVFHKVEKLEKSYNVVARLHNQINQLGPRQMAVLSQDVERLNGSIAETHAAWTTLVELANMVGYRLPDHLVGRLQNINQLMENLAVEGEKVLIEMDKADARPNIFDASEDQLNSKVYLAVEKARNEKRSLSLEDIDLEEDILSGLGNSWSFRYIKSDEDKEEIAAEKAKKQRELMIRKYSAASKTWQSKWILMLSDIVSDLSPIKLSTSYIGASLTTQSNSGLLADNLMKDEKLKPTEKQVDWILDCLANKLKTPALISPGGGLSIQSLAFGHAYQMFASDMVSYKAYICSAQNAAVIKTAKCKLALGTKGLIEVDDDGNAILDTEGKYTFCYDENEGSHFLKSAYALSLGLYDETCELVMQMRAFDSQACDRLDSIGNSYRKEVTEYLRARQNEMFILVIQMLEAFYHHSQKDEKKLAKIFKSFNSKTIKAERKIASKDILKLRGVFKSFFRDMEAGKLSEHLKELQDLVIASCETGLSASKLRKVCATVYKERSFTIKKVEDVVAARNKGFKLPEYTRSSMFGFDESEGYIADRAMFLKGIFVPDHTPAWEFVHGQPFEFDGVANNRDGIKCDLKGFAVDTVNEHLLKKANVISAKEMRERKFKPKAFILSRSAEDCTVGIMKTFNTNSKVRLASQWVETTVANLSHSESNVKATEESSKKFLDFWSPKRREQFDEIVACLKKLGNPVSTDWAPEPINWDSDSLPNDLYNMLLSIKYRNLRETDFFAKKKESQLKGNLGGLVNLLDILGFPLESYSAFRARVDSFTKFASEAARGGGIRGKNIVAMHSALIPDYTVVLASWIRKALGFKKNSRPDCVLGRYPVVASTSVSKFTVIFDDDSEFEDLFIEAGYKAKGGSIPYMAIVNELGKFLFQMDDDGDTLAILIALMILGDMSLAEMLDGIEDGDVEAINKAYELIESWVAVASSIPEREDVQPVAVELPTIKGGKDKYEVLDSEGNFTKEYLELSGKDSRGAVGLVTDAKSVIYAKSVCGKYMIIYNREKGFQLQHCVDAAKKTKLCIPPKILMLDSTWHWNGEFWEIPTKTLELLEKWILSYSKIAFEMSQGGWIAEIPKEVREVENTGLVPTFETLLQHFSKFDAFLWAPNTLIKKVAEVAGGINTFGKTEIDGVQVYIPFIFNEIVDPHMYHPAQILQSMPDSDGAWKQWAPYRKPPISEMFELKYSEKTESSYLGSMPDSDGFPNFWTPTDRNQDTCFLGILEDNVPNTVYKNISRWALEVGFGSKMGKVKGFIRKNGKLPSCEISWSALESQVPNTMDLSSVITSNEHFHAWNTDAIGLLTGKKSSFSENEMKKLYSFFIDQLQVNLLKEDGSLRNLNKYQMIFAHKIRSYFGPDYNFQSFCEPPKGVKESHWMTMKFSIAADILYSRISESSKYSPCPFTKKIDLKGGRSDWLETVKEYSTQHMLIDMDAEDAVDGDGGIALTKCPHCVREIRKQIALINRNSDEGTHNAKVLREKKDKAMITQAAIESIFMQHQHVAKTGKTSMEGIPCVTEKSLLSWVEAYGTEDQKEAYGVQDLDKIKAMINSRFKEVDIVDFNDWLKDYCVAFTDRGNIIKNYSELKTMDNMKDINRTIRLDISEYYLTELLKLMSLFENSQDPFVPKRYETKPTEPTPPTGGGGGSISSTPKPQVKSIHKPFEAISPKVEKLLKPHGIAQDGFTTLGYVSGQGNIDQECNSCGSKKFIKNALIDQLEWSEVEIDGSKVTFTALRNVNKCDDCPPAKPKVEVEQVPLPLPTSIKGARDEKSKFHPDQLKAIIGITDNWLPNTSNRQSLSGAAGTGKTFCLLEIIERYCTKYNYADVIFTAPTGAAVKVFKEKAKGTRLEGIPAKTLHSLFFHNDVSGSDYSSVANPEIKGLGARNLVIIDEASMLGSRTAEKINEAISANLYRSSVDIIDILFVGDSNQLPPVNDEPYIDLKKADYTLTKVYRNGGNILKYATKLTGKDIGEPKFDEGDLIAKKNLSLPMIVNLIAFKPNRGIYYHLAKNNNMTIEEAEEELRKEVPYVGDYMIYSIGVCYTNRTRIKINNGVRKKMGLPKEVTAGDNLIFFNGFSSFVNSEIVIVKHAKIDETLSKLVGESISEVTVYDPETKNEVSFHMFSEGCKEFDYRLKKQDKPQLSINVGKPASDKEISKKVQKRIEERLTEIDEALVEDFKFHKDGRFQGGLSEINEEVRKAVEDWKHFSRYFNYAQVDFAYAITCHKAQGNQWENVIVLKENALNKSDDDEFKRKWEYTACTRAEIKLVIVSYNNYIKNY